MIIGISYALYNTSRQNKLAQAQRIEQMRQARLLEIARLDSIRQDSINFRNFSTTDLSFFELHGKVKCVYYTSLSTQVSELFDTRQYKFDENGTLKNKQSLLTLMEPDGEYLYRWEYNENGFPTKGIFAESGGCPEMYWNWNSDGKLIKSFNRYGNHGSGSEYEYDSEGNLSSVRYEEHANMGVEVIMNTKVEIIETDKWGNWLKRNLTQEMNEGYDCIGDDTIPHDGYKIVDYGEYKRFEKRDTTFVTETRKIYYH